MIDHYTTGAKFPKNKSLYKDFIFFFKFPEAELN